MGVPPPPLSGPTTKKKDLQNVLFDHLKKKVSLKEMTDTQMILKNRKKKHAK